jgi:hypothetical protein
VDGNQFSPAIPAEFQNLSSLEEFRLNDNMLEELPDLSVITTLSEIRIFNNKFNFEDIEPNITIPTILYSPQDSVGLKQDTTIGENENLTLSVTVGGTANQYQWMKDSIDIPGADSSSYFILSVQLSDSGSYVCKITNTIATELTLFSRPVHVTVGSGGGISTLSSKIPEVYALKQNYPNPFNPATTIEFDLPKASDVTLKIFNVLGEEVEKLVSERLSAGSYSYHWSRTGGMASGIYLYRLKAGDPSQGAPNGQGPTGQAGQGFVETKKMVLMR